MQTGRLTFQLIIVLAERCGPASAEWKVSSPVLVESDSFELNEFVHSLQLESSQVFQACPSLLSVSIRNKKHSIYPCTAFVKTTVKSILCLPTVL